MTHLRVLDVGGVLTTRQERPRLVSRPMPAEWRVLPGAGTYRHATGVTDWLDRAKVRTMARDLLALIDWLDHEDAVRAQDGGS